MTSRRGETAERRMKRSPGGVASAPGAEAVSGDEPRQ